MPDSKLPTEKDFSVVVGGPFFQLLRRAHLTGDALELIRLRTVVITLFAWLPLLVLSLLNGQALEGTSYLPFLKDYSNLIRFLVGLPLLIIAEVVVHQRMMLLISQFVQRKLIPEAEITKFYAAFESAKRWRNSIAAEALMIAVVLGIGYQLLWKQAAGIESEAWYNVPAVAGTSLSMAGIWFRYVSLPLFQFLLLRWYYRILIWARFVFQVSKIKLQLLPTHPDHVGGLGFLSNAVHAFIPLALAHGVLTAAVIANKIAYHGAALPEFKVEIAVVVLWVILLVLFPLMFFASQLGDAKRNGGLEYGHLSSRFAREFEGRWMKEEWPKEHGGVGADIQSLSDLANSYSVVENMRVVPITRNALIMLVVTTLAPIAPLVLTMMPLSEVLKMVAGALF
ncbi:MAG: hypothetical protein JNL40_17165 [Cyclobacteriaceae bacterium]|nr:hypothetical protein [Cyclobacteriaceae bacterium]